MSEFKVGDRVSWAGVEGEVIEVDNMDIKSVGVKFVVEEHVRWFYSDGKRELWHKEPSLIKLPQKKKVTLWRHYFSYDDGTIGFEEVIGWDWNRYKREYPDCKHIESKVIDEIEVPDND